MWLKILNCPILQSVSLIYDPSSFLYNVYGKTLFWGKTASKWSWSLTAV
jgi:hypothetical protein